jgi:alkylation response protein AidB-like acyl-CoA dehydrogenase
MTTLALEYETALIDGLPAGLHERDLARIARHAAAADTAGWLHPGQQAILHRRGWLRLLAPKAAGGAELPLPAMVRLEEAVARADGSTGWVLTLCAGAGWFAGFLPPDVARDLIGTRRLCVAGSGAPTGYADLESDGFRINGRWDYASGAPMGTHFTLNAVLRERGRVSVDAAGAPRIRAFIVPKRQVTLESSWRTIGLRASASHAYRIESQWVAREHGFEISADSATVDGPLYRFPFYSLAFVTLAANLAGMAAHFLALAEPCIAARRVPGMLPAVGRRIERALNELAQARAAFYQMLDQSWARVVSGAALDDGETSAIKAASLDLVDVARRAVDGLYPYCGLLAAGEGSEINRVWRDFHTATQHALLLPL